MKQFNSIKKILNLILSDKIILLNIFIFAVLSGLIIFVINYKIVVDNSLENKLQGADYQAKITSTEQIFNKDIFLEFELSSSLKDICNQLECFFYLEAEIDSEFTQISSLYDFKQMPSQIIIMKKYLDSKSVTINPETQVRLRYKIYSEDKFFDKNSDLFKITL